MFYKHITLLKRRSVWKIRININVLTAAGTDIPFTIITFFVKQPLLMTQLYTMYKITGWNIRG